MLLDVFEKTQPEVVIFGRFKVPVILKKMDAEGYIEKVNVEGLSLYISPALLK